MYCRGKGALTEKGDRGVHIRGVSLSEEDVSLSMRGRLLEHRACYPHECMMRAGYQVPVVGFTLRLVNRLPASLIRGGSDDARATAPQESIERFYGDDSLSPSESVHV